ncbi:polyprenyl synthetase family protein [Amycolatopsis sp. NPDC051758]|uniref:polyprenyl synthetase family protein n=1 Tax=Amycolatopsis sp. NPDC051758 TaxID=3363935 RepID=UPI003794A655
MALDDFSARVTNRLRYLAAGIPAPLRGSVETLIARPGKRLRTAMLYACAMLGSPSPGRPERAAAVVELMHIASLLHDDIVDRAAERRGAPAAHTQVGTESAILTGLACFSTAGMEAADLGPGAYRTVTRAAARLAYGQVLDLERAFDVDLSIEDYLELASAKTGELFRLCCRMGAAEGRCKPDVLRAAVHFGSRTGIAFQILDDCLDLEAAATGKPRGTDLLRGLIGAPVVLALTHDTDHSLTALLLDPRLTAGDIPAVAEHITRLGGITAARELAATQLDHARHGLDSLPDTPGRAALRGLLHSVENAPA